MTFLPRSQNRSPLLAQLLAEDPQFAAGQAALQAGSSTAPVQSPLEGFARALQGAAGGYFTGQARQRAQGQQDDYSATLAKALQAAQGWRNPDMNAMPGQVAQESYDATAANVGNMEPRRYLAPGETVQGGSNAMASVLAGNPDTAPLGLNLRFQEMQAQAEARRALELERQKAAMEPPKTRNVRIGNEQVTQEFDPRTRQWDEIGRGAAFAPPQPPAVVNLPPALKAEDQEFGKALVGQYEKVVEAATGAGENIQQLHVLRSIPVQTGPGTDWKATVTTVANAIGVPVPEGAIRQVKDVQSFKAITGNLLASKLASQKGPQTDDDARRMGETLASTENFAEANDFIIRSALATESRKVEQANFYDAYRNERGTFSGVRAAWEKHKRETPLLGVNPNTRRTVFFTEFMEEAGKANPGASREDLMGLWRQKYGSTR